MSIPVSIERAVRRYGLRRAARRAPRAIRRRLHDSTAAGIERLSAILPIGIETARTRRVIRDRGLDPRDMMEIADPRFGRQLVRKGTTDWPTYHQVFVKEEYLFDLPEPRTIVDLGANVGYAAVYYHSRYPDARIIAIEPGSENATVARANIDLACRPGAVDVVESAVWHSAAQLKITNPNANAWAYRVNVAEPGEAGSFPAVTMPMIMDQFGFATVDLVKIDIEAGERFLFAEHTDWLDRVNAMVIELHDRHTPGCREPVIAALDRHFVDYDEVVKGENTLFTRRRPVETVTAK